MDRPHFRHGTPRPRHHQWYRARRKPRSNPEPSRVTPALLSQARSERARESAGRSTIFAWITLLQNELRAWQNPVTPATSPAPVSVRNWDRELRAFTSSIGSLAHHAACLNTRSKSNNSRRLSSRQSHEFPARCEEDTIDACIKTDRYRRKCISAFNLSVCRRRMELTGFLHSPRLVVYR